MRKKVPIPFASLILFICMVPAPQAKGAEKKPQTDIRPSILAGSWYPGDRQLLRKTIQAYLSRVDSRLPTGQLKGILVPHAGYPYSGQVAAYAYALLKDRSFKRVILVGPSHRMAFRGVSVNLRSGYQTPLGVVPVDRGTAKKIMDLAPFIRWVKQAHAMEHSLEIQLPFLQMTLRDFQIVPLLMGQQDYKTCLNLAEALTQAVLGSPNTLLLASTDLSHYHPYKRARELDLQFVKRIREFDPEGLSKDLSQGKCEACGGGPATTILLASRALGADRAVILKYANSGDVTHDYDRVVGYLSAALIATR